VSLSSGLRSQARDPRLEPPVQHPPSPVADLVRSPDSSDDLDALAARAKELDAQLRERICSLDEARTSLETFRLRYAGEVGRLHEELDRLELEIAEAELGELSKKLEESGTGSTPPPPPEDVPRPARFTSDAVRKLFRDVAKIIHPDLAQDPHTRDRRTALMIEANRAYARGDEAQLRWILDAWARSPEAVHGSDPDAERERLERRVAQLAEQLERLDLELAKLRTTPLWELKAMVDREAIRGRDLIADMVRRLQRDIMVATNRLEAMRG